MAMSTACMQTPRRQHGAAAIEFALVFGLFFAVLYGTVSYSLPMLLMQSFNNATAEGARRAVGVALRPGEAGYQHLVLAQARSAVQQELNWLPPALQVPDSAIITTLDNATGVLSVTVSYPPGKLNSVIPSMPLVPSINELPPITSRIKLY